MDLSDKVPKLYQAELSGIYISWKANAIAWLYDSSNIGPIAEKTTPIDTPSLIDFSGTTFICLASGVYIAGWHFRCIKYLAFS